jgi:hypothetical protein
MYCYRCDVCGEVISEKAATFCLPVIIGTEDGSARRCWCVCEACRPYFLKRTTKVLEEKTGT